METLSRWLERKGAGSEEKALDYLNKKGLFGKNNKLSAIDQIKEIEKTYARDLYFQDCERKLKNNIRQDFSKSKNPNSKPYTFKLSNNSRHLLERIKTHYGITTSQALEMLIYNEDARLSGTTNQLAPHINSQQNHGAPMSYNNVNRVAGGSTSTPQYSVWHDENVLQSLQKLKIFSETINNPSLHNKKDDQLKDGILQNTGTPTQVKRDY